MIKTTIEIDNELIGIEISKHAEERMDERELNKYEVFSLIMKMGENILDLKDGEEFAVIDKELQNAVICSINSRDNELIIDVITVISDYRIWISRGTKVYKVSDINFSI